MSAFFVSALLFFTCSIVSADINEPCALESNDKADETVIVSYVYDGDTVKLRDGRKIRIIGINTPELGSTTKASEPFAREARNFVRTLIKKSNKVQIRYGVEKKDHYGRLLAHVFLGDKRNLAALLLQNGLARSLHVPPNEWQFRCYDQLDKQAQQLKVGLWSNKLFQTVNVNFLKPGAAYKSKFTQISGEVSRVTNKKNTIWVYLGPQFILRFNKGDLSIFEKINFDKLRGKKVMARGYVVYYPERHQFRMSVRHPVALTLFK